MNWLSCDAPKNSFSAAEIGFELIRSCGISASVSAWPRRSLTAFSIRARPERYWFSASSPTQRTRRLPRWSMSSTSPRPLRSSTRILTTSRMSSLRERHRAFGRVAADAGVELHPADARQVVGVGAVEEAMEERLDGVFGRRLAGPHHAVDGDARGELVGGLVGRERLRDVGAFVELVGVERGDFLDAGHAQLLQQRFGQLVVGLGEDLAGLGVDDVSRQHAADEVVLGDAR